MLILALRDDGVDQILLRWARVNTIEGVPASPNSVAPTYLTS